MGAEQGDALGTIQATLTLGGARQRHWGCDDVSRGVCDEWYIDDGQVFLRPSAVDSWLRALDAGIASFGGIRGAIFEETQEFCTPPMSTRVEVTACRLGHALCQGICDQ